MIDPYRMIVINILFSVLLIIGVFIYSKIFKKKINFLALLILISCLPLISVFRRGTYESGDFTFHVYRAMAFYDALKDGVLIPSWAANLNQGFGYSVFSFIYIVPYYLMSILHLIGFTFIFSERLVISGAFMSSGIMMYFILKKLTSNELASFSGAIVYLFMPYHLVDIHFRVAIAESIAFTLTSAIFYLILKVQKKPKLLHYLWMSLIFGLLFLTHPVMFLFYTALFTVFILYKILIKQDKLKTLYIFLASLLTGFLISSFAWVPRFTLINITFGKELAKTPVEYVEVWKLLFSPWRLGFLFQGHKGELSFLIGYTEILILIIALYIVIKNKKSIFRKDIIFWIFISLSMVFLMLPYSKPIWNLVPFLKLMQFSYRFLHPLIFCTAILTAYIFTIYKNKKMFIYLFIFLTIGYTILNWGNRGTVPYVNDNYLRSTLSQSTKEGERMIEPIPLWWNTSKDFLEPANSHLEIVAGKANIKEIKRTSVYHSYVVNAPNDSTLVENTLYFPDWTIRIDGKNVPINYNTREYHARMVFNVAQGIHFIEAQYYDIKPIIITKRISAFIVLAIVILLILHYTSAVIDYLKRKYYGKNKKSKKQN